MSYHKHKHHKRHSNHNHKNICDFCHCEIETNNFLGDNPYYPRFIVFCGGEFDDDVISEIDANDILHHKKICKMCLWNLFNTKAFQNKKLKDIIDAHFTKDEIKSIIKELHGKAF